MKKTEQNLLESLETAYRNVHTGHGGPFGAVVVRDGIIIGRGSNEVTHLNDPTAHAEVQAIREACKALSSFQLTDCEIYTSCEPCPMCLGAIYWARPKAVYYFFSQVEAAAIGFDDQFIYDQIALPMEERSIPFQRIQFPLQPSQDPFLLWRNHSDKIEY